jgi:enolase-phosphatase E1
LTRTVTFNLSASSVQGILLDIEGTTSPIDFVYQVLFPFVRVHLKDYLRHNAASEELQRDLSMLREEHLKDLKQALAPPEWADAHLDAQIESVAHYVFWLMDRDRKSTGLKSLQGKIWQRGYLTGELKGQVFQDVPPALEYWKNKNLDVRIFSSGSALAQRLLFANTEVGDLTRFLGGYFDTNIGPKTDPESYRQIANEFHLPAAKVLFISDMTAELDAAKRAGMQTLLCVRPGNLPQPEKHSHSVIYSFSEIVG